MRLFLLACCVVLASAAVEVQKNYHDAVGFPLAKSIKDAEDKIHASDGMWTRASHRIVGGAVAPTNAHPYLGGLVITFAFTPNRSACGSSLVTSNRLITAAHCWFDGRNQANAFEVVLGSAYLFFGGTRISTRSVAVHPQWTPSILRNDIAVIYLPNSVVYSASIQAIALPTGSELSNSFAGQWATAAGYGITRDSQQGVSLETVISQVRLQVITEQQCANVFTSTYVTYSTICTSGSGGIGICSGDSGGPLVIQRNGRPILVGVSSFVAGAGCQLGFPSAFARVTSFNSFINQHL